MINSTNDITLRCSARTRGFILEKHRGFCSSLGNGYLIRDAYSGEIVMGERYDLSAVEVRDFLNNH